MVPFEGSWKRQGTLHVTHLGDNTVAASRLIFLSCLFFCSRTIKPQVMLPMKVTKFALIFFFEFFTSDNFHFSIKERIFVVFALLSTCDFSHFIKRIGSSHAYINSQTNRKDSFPLWTQTNFAPKSNTTDNPTSMPHKVCPRFVFGPSTTI